MFPGFLRPRSGQFKTRKISNLITSDIPGATSLRSNARLDIVINPSDWMWVISVWETFKSTAVTILLSEAELTQHVDTCKIVAGWILEHFEVQIVEINDFPDYVTADAPRNWFISCVKRTLFNINFPRQNWKTYLYISLLWLLGLWELFLICSRPYLAIPVLKYELSAVSFRM